MADERAVVLDSGVVIAAFNLNRAYGLFRKYNGKHPGFSYADALSVALMERDKIRRIASLDSDFDGIRGIERISSPRDVK